MRSLSFACVLSVLRSLFFSISHSLRSGSSLRVLSPSLFFYYHLRVLACVLSLSRAISLHAILSRDSTFASSLRSHMCSSSFFFVCVLSLSRAFSYRLIALGNPASCNLLSLLHSPLSSMFQV